MSSPSTSRAAPASLPGRHSLARIFEPCLSLIVRLRSATGVDDAGAVRRSAARLLDRAESAARETGLSDAAITDADFAITAFLDETVQGSDWENKEPWVTHPLQLERFGRYDAGEEFFVRLEALRSRRDEQPAALEVYYLCLALGFRGRYQVQDQTPVQDLLQDLADDLSASEAGGDRFLSPPLPDEAGAPKGVDLSMTPLRIAVVALLLVSLVYLGIRSSASSRAAQTRGELIDRLQTREQTDPYPSAVSLYRQPTNSGTAGSSVASQPESPVRAAPDSDNSRPADR